VTEKACDGFTVMPPLLPASLHEFVDQVIPELQRRGLFRTQYEATTLRGNLGLTRPPWSAEGATKRDPERMKRAV
jgi:alkanesulfonate monooxygenase